MFASSPRAGMAHGKSGAIDITDGYERRMNLWKESLLRQGKEEMVHWEEVQNIQQYIALLQGKFWPDRRPKFRSSFVDNYLEDMRREALSSLSQIRPALEVYSKVPAYKEQARVVHNYMRYLWTENDLDLRVVEWLDHALFGTGFLKQVAAPDAFFFVCKGPGEVIPVLCNGDIQESAAVIDRAYKPIGYFIEKFGIDKCRGLEREAVHVTAGLGQDQFGRPDDVCLAPHALIQDSCGRLIPICEFGKDTLAIASDGMPTRGELHLSHRHDEPTIELKTWGTFGNLPTTVDHNILTPDGFREAQDIQIGDFIRRPVRQISEKTTSITLLERRNGDHRNEPEAFNPVEVPANFNWGWLFGLYLAEGTVWAHKDNSEGNYSVVQFGIDRDEEDAFTESLRRALGEDFHVACYRHKHSMSSVLGIYRASLARFIAENFGVGDDKRIPDWAWDCGKEFCRGLIAGYIEGDGHLHPRHNGVVAKSVRAAIVLQIRELMLSLGFGWAKIDYIPEGEYSGRNCRAIYALRTNSTTGRNLRKAMGWPCYEIDKTNHTFGDKYWHYSEDGRYLDVAVEDKTTGFAEKFYNLEVESGLHDFLTLHGTAKNSEYKWDALSPFFKRRALMRRGLWGQGPSRMGGTEGTPHPVIELQEVYSDDWSVNESDEEVWVHHPDLTREEHNYHYLVPPGCRLYPRKRLTIFAGDRVMYDGPSPFWHGQYPYTMLQLNPCVFMPGGISKYRDIVPLNAAINRAGAGVEESITNAFNRTLVGKRGAIPDAVWDQIIPGKPGQKILGNPIMQRGDLFWMDSPSIPSGTDAALNYWVQTVKKRSGALDTQGMMRKKQQPGGEAIEQMREAMSQPYQLEGRYLEAAICRSGKQLCSNIFQYATLDGRLRVLGSDGMTWADCDYDPNIMKPFSTPPTDHWRQFSIRIAPGSSHGASRMAKKVEALTLWRAGGLSLQGLYEQAEFPADYAVEIERIKKEHEMGIGPGSPGRQPRQTRGQRNGQPV